MDRIAIRPIGKGLLRLLWRGGRQGDAASERQRKLTVQFEEEGHHPECAVWHTRRWCDCKSLPRDVVEPGYGYVCSRSDAGHGSCRHERLE